VGHRLIEDEQFAATTFVVIDFETTTPPGSRPEPIDVGLLSLRVQAGDLQELARYQALMRPPAHAPVTPFDTDQTGITPAMVAEQLAAADVLARLDRRFTQPPYLLVAHNAPTEGGLLYDYRQYCPTLASLDLLDTVRLARHLYPDLPNHKLDTLLVHLDIPFPPDRHRAMPDVEATTRLFRRIIDDADRAQLWITLRGLHAAAGYPAKANKPEQTTLFG
jgi:DNA polymerase III epsilon subunit-like protein